MSVVWHARIRDCRKGNVMGLFFKSKKSPKEICDGEIAKMLQKERPLNDNYFGNLVGSSVKIFDENERLLGPGELTSPIMMLDAMMADCMHLCKRPVSKTYREDPPSIEARYQLFTGYLQAIKDYTDEDRKAARIVCELFLENKRQKLSFLYLDRFFKMPLPELIPARLMDEIAEEYLKNNDRSGAFILYNNYVNVESEVQGKINYAVASILSDIDGKKYADYIAKRIKAAADLGYPDAVAVMKSYNESLKAAADLAGKASGEAPAQDNAGVSEMQARLKAADAQFAQSGDPEVYYKICSEGIDKVSEGKESDWVFEAARKYTDAVDAMAAAGKIRADQIPLLYKQRQLHYVLAGHGFKDYYSKAADAVRDGYGNVPQEPSAARHFYSLAAAEGDRYGQFYYGLFCMAGVGGKADYNAALDAFNSVIQGHDDILSARAYFNLYNMFLTGRGVPKDTETAASCLALARNWGWDEDAQKIHELRGKLGKFFKEMGDDPRAREEILPRLIDPQTKSIVLPPLI